eukprot:CAMPEP_0116568470 /NCGR_PEP_ID=MMETSP0397-20121206/15667_1 /TAXON_ID=216820 /ORGANISM="Cyclophora tenuis, Strain ECT3854" /LENGTH=41 /DNA_ID= /DNA_START= /DNA_END= /DNA_ORIENTATION=
MVPTPFGSRKKALFPFCSTPTENNLEQFFGEFCGVNSALRV